MAFWATGVSVVTARGTEGPAGATANALTSLSLEPPLVLVCFDTSSRTLGAVRESGHFAINVLALGQYGTSRLFATKLAQEEKFAESVHRLELGVPVLDGCIAWLVCSLESEFSRGDHVVAIGAVLTGGYNATAEPLVFFRGSYSGLTDRASASSR
jgi:3-hydroxy-9,10-secoandrosta-1,3,5(10)-triene-9,17-dione monooxygenase reductase component